jgi:hypothetical protein
LSSSFSDDLTVDESIGLSFELETGDGGSGVVSAAAGVTFTSLSTNRVSFDFSIDVSLLGRLGEVFACCCRDFGDVELERGGVLLISLLVVVCFCFMSAVAFLLSALFLFLLEEVEAGDRGGCAASAGFLPPFFERWGRLFTIAHVALIRWANIETRRKTNHRGLRLC